MCHAHPTLTCRESLAYEQQLLGEDSRKIWQAMQRAGRRVGRTILQDVNEVTPTFDRGSLWVLVGKGHNGGDALLAAREILKQRPRVTAVVFLAAEIEALKPLTQRALHQFQTEGEERITVRQGHQEKKEQTDIPRDGIVMIDGLLGMACRPPLRQPYSDMILWANAQEGIQLRAAVDLPSGLSDTGTDSIVFHADFTYATGIAKTPLFTPANRHSVGRIRYLDLGFFSPQYPTAAQAGILLPQVLQPLKSLRNPQSDKRSFGHLFLLGGAPGMGGALLMATAAAVRSGLGLATATTVPKNIPALTTYCPEAMTLAWPEKANRLLATTGLAHFMAQWHRASALLIGPGLLADEATVALVSQLIEASPHALVLDAGALHPRVIAALAKRPDAAGPVVLTPHAGEFCRLAACAPDTSIDDGQIMTFCAAHKVILVLKGSITRICDGRRLVYSTFGGPVLARGGSGDLLAGLTGSLLAQVFAGAPAAQTADTATRAWTAACQAVTWHGLAAESLARRHGQTAVHTTALLGFLSSVLRTV